MPVHPVYQVQDWDAAEGAIDWQRMITFLEQVKATGEIPADHHSHDHLNEQKAVPIGDDFSTHWREQFEEAKRKRAERGEARIVWGLVDGFLLYWHPVSR